jgi:hypothetical protein
MREAAVIFVKLLMGAIGALLTVYGAIFSLLERVPSATLCLTAGLVLLLLSVSHQFESIKGFGVEVKLREAIAKAQVTIESLQSVALMSVRAMLNQAARAAVPRNRNADLESVLPIYRQAMESKAALAAQGVTTDQIRLALEGWLSNFAQHVGFHAGIELSKIWSEQYRLAQSELAAAQGGLTPELWRPIEERFAFSSRVLSDINDLHNHAPMTIAEARRRLLHVKAIESRPGHTSLLSDAIDETVDRLDRVNEELGFDEKELARWP